jgi:endonuclease YncB( thermonuclease family)
MKASLMLWCLHAHAHPPYFKRLRAALVSGAAARRSIGSCNGIRACNWWSTSGTRKPVGAACLGAIPNRDTAHIRTLSRPTSIRLCRRCETVAAMPGSAVLLCLVIGIADGDTLSARCDSGSGNGHLVVRLAGIDAPEKRQPFGQRSRLAALCFKRRAAIAPRVIDRYGRTVGTVSCDGSDASFEQVRAGMAWVYTRYAPDADIRIAEQDARRRRLGLWADASPVEPWTWRASKTAQCGGHPPWPRKCFVLDHERAHERGQILDSSAIQPAPTPDTRHE